MSPAEIEAAGAMVSAVIDLGGVLVNGVRGLLAELGFSTPSDADLEKIVQSTRAQIATRIANRSKAVPA